MIKRFAGALLVAALLAVVAFIIFSPKNESPKNKVSPPHQQDAKQQPDLEVPVDFNLPLYTKRAALVCPLAVVLDRREGHGLKAAVDAHLSIFGHDEAVEKSGCQEWREGLPVSLTDEGQEEAKEWETKKSCGMATFTEGYIFSCDLRNSPTSDAASAAPQN